MNNQIKLFFLGLLLTSSAFAQTQGNCDWFIKINPALSKYLNDHSAKCWYGTATDDTIKVTQSYQVMVNGKEVGVYGPDLNIFLGFGGNDTLSGRNKTDWIYGGPGHDTIYVMGTTTARGGQDADRFYSTSLDKSFIQKHILDYNFGSGDIVYQTYDPTEGQAYVSTTSSNDDCSQPKAGCPCSKEDPITGDPIQGHWHTVENMHTGEETLECTILSID